MAVPQSSRYEKSLSWLEIVPYSYRVMQNLRRLPLCVKKDNNINREVDVQRLCDVGP